MFKDEATKIRDGKKRYKLERHYYRKAKDLMEEILF